MNDAPVPVDRPWTGCLACAGRSDSCRHRRVTEAELPEPGFRSGVVEFP